MGSQGGNNEKEKKKKDRLPASGGEDGKPPPQDKDESDVSEEVDSGVISRLIAMFTKPALVPLLLTTLPPPTTNAAPSDQAVERPPPVRNSRRNNFTWDPFIIKAYMDGNPLGRNVDLNAHTGYQSLLTAVHRLFASRLPWDSNSALRLIDGSSDYVLTYEDNDGDWMLVGDLPWGVFLNNVQRLRIMISPYETQPDRSMF